MKSASDALEHIDPRGATGVEAIEGGSRGSTLTDVTSDRKYFSLRSDGPYGRVRDPDEFVFLI